MEERSENVKKILLNQLSAFYAVNCLLIEQACLRDSTFVITRNDRNNVGTYR